MSDSVTSREVVSEPPTDLQHPRLYEYTTWILGAIALACIVAIAILTGLNKSVEGVITGLVAIAASAVGGLVNLLMPRK